MRTRTWAIALLAMALTAGACGGSGGTRQGSPVIIHEPSAKVTTVAPTTVAPTTVASISCGDYANGMLPFIEVTTSLFEAYGLIVTEVADGTISFATAAELSATVTEGFELVQEGVTDLGTPPSGVARSVRLFQQAMDEVIKGSRLTTRMFDAGSFDRAAEALAFINEGTELFYQSAEALPAGGC